MLLCRVDWSGRSVASFVKQVTLQRGSGEDRSSSYWHTDVDTVKPCKVEPSRLEQSRPLFAEQRDGWREIWNEAIDG